MVAAAPWMTLLMITVFFFLRGLGEIVHEMKLEMLKRFFNPEVSFLIFALPIQPLANTMCVFFQALCLFYDL